MAISYLQGETKLLVTLNLNSESLRTVAEVFLLRLWLQLFKPNPSITHLIFTLCLFGWPSTTRLTVVFPWCQWDLILTIKTCYLGGIFQTIMLSFRKKKLIKLLLFPCIKCIINYTCLTGLNSPLQKGKCLLFLTKSCITHSAQTKIWWNFAFLHILWIMEPNKTLCLLWNWSKLHWAMVNCLWFSHIFVITISLKQQFPFA